mmetsp:Transcript_10422/g.44353  ORF Transcript_10422/g.44353 Transcript_10422/m.44353 type:complete len:255 (+) Transcript_10422:91-855(+)
MPRMSSISPMFTARSDTSPTTLMFRFHRFVLSAASSSNFAGAIFWPSNRTFFSLRMYCPALVPHVTGIMSGASVFGTGVGSAAGAGSVGAAAGGSRFVDAERVERRVLVVSALPTDRLGRDPAPPLGFDRVAAVEASRGSAASVRGSGSGSPGGTFLFFASTSSLVASASFAFLAAGAGLTPAGVAAAEAGVESPEVAFAVFERRFAVAALSSIFRFPGLVARCIFFPSDAPSGFPEATSGVTCCGFCEGFGLC